MTTIRLNVDQELDVILLPSLFRIVLELGVCVPVAAEPAGVANTLLAKSPSQPTSPTYQLSNSPPPAAK